MTSRTKLRMICIYLGALLVVPALLFGLSAIALQAVQGPRSNDEPKRTLLAERIETAREIRRALDAPIPPAEPLQPITQKPVHAVGSRVVDQRPRQSSKPKLSSRALEAFAMDRGFAPREAYPSFDRHAIR